MNFIWGKELQTGWSNLGFQFTVSHTKSTGLHTEMTLVAVVLAVKTVKASACSKHTHTHTFTGYEAA